MRELIPVSINEHQKLKVNTLFVDASTIQIRNNQK